MPIFKKEKYFEADPRFIFVKDIGELKKLSRHFNKISGIFLPYDPLNPAELEEIRTYVLGKISPERPKFEAAFVRYKQAWRHREMKYEYPKSLGDIMDTLEKAYDIAIGGKPEDGKFRVNVHLPDDAMHAHYGLTYALTGDGTLAKNLEGELYNFPTRHIAVFKDDVEHMAPQDRSTYDDPRISFAMG